MVKLADVGLLKFGHSMLTSGVVFAGDGRALLASLPEAHGEPLPELEVLDLDLDEWQRLLGQLDTLETEVTARAGDGTLTKAILRKTARQIAAAVTWKVFKRDGYQCRYCGNNDTPLTGDHLVCWESGGPSTEANMVACCKRCNKTRGNLSYDEWLRHPYYLKVSRALSEDLRRSNEALAATLATIPRLDYIRSR